MGDSQGTGAEALTPFGMELSRVVFDRATLVAEGLFPGATSLVILVKDGVAWRSRLANADLPTRDSAAETVIATGQMLWIEDAHADPRFANDPAVTGPPFLRAYIGAPIRLADGTTPGVLAVASLQPIPKDDAKAVQLQALADFVADEWARAQIANQHARSQAELGLFAATRTAMLSLIPMSLLITDADMCVVAASKVWERHLQVEDGSYLGRSVYEVSPQVYEPFRKSFDYALRGNPISGRRVRVARHNAPGNMWMQTELVPWRHANGEIGGLLVLADDITEMVEALESAERTEQRLNLALELSSLHVWEMDYVQKKLFTAGSADFFDPPLTYERLEANILAGVDPRDREIAAEAWRAHAEDGAPYRPQYRIARTDGREIWADAAVSLHLDEAGRPQRLVGAIQDITARKKAEATLIVAKEEAESATRAKSAFLATMSHEIRTPLNGVLGMAQAMEADALDPVQRERLGVIRQSGETLLAILNDVLDLSKIEAGKLELEASEFDIQDLARGAYAAFTAIANKKGLSFDLEIEAAARGVYRGDSTRLRQVIYNLVSNAIKFTERGAVQVRVARDGGELVVSVTDSGIGIAPEALSRLFAKFEQADSTTTRRYGGTGLGLAICRELAELMGGAITAESTPGAGSCFTLRAPVARLAAEGRAAPATPAPPAPEPGDQELRVLAAEDNEVNRLVLQTLLNQVGVSPTIVHDGAQAVDAWEREAWDLILMDVQMPVMDGPTATRTIRAREAALGRPRTPIIALTANAMDHQVAEYYAAGMDGFVPKPIAIATLYAAINAALAAEPEAAAAQAG